jgi:acyl dehydratase
MPDDTLLYYEDLPVGAVFVTAPHLVEAAEIIDFAQQYDPQPFHLDDTAARSSLFGGLAASGWHTAAMSMRLQVDSGPRVAGGLIGAGGELSWPLPTRPGDTLRVHSEVIAARLSATKPDRGLVTIRNETRNQTGAAVQVFTATIVVPRRATV